MSFEKLKFRFRAKGRHGTHSPFVYAFVERVLRSKEIFGHCPQGFSAKSWQRLNASLQYLAVKEILFPEGVSYGEIIMALSKNWPEIKMKVFTAGTLPVAVDRLLLLCPDDQSTIGRLQEGQLPHINGRFSIYVLEPHRNDQTVLDMLSLKNNAAFKMVLDFWQGLLLVRSDDFKEKQFFELI